ncbi:MAG: 30S ribosome-binding factor RbfA [Clostridiales bacterium]|nr:30S ribosome-binding factor RbfA [Clostridiales bacterium]
MKPNSRIAKVNDEILRETADIIRSELKDPRIGSIVSVLKAETSPDLGHCKIFVSILGDLAAQEETLTGLSSASGFIRKRLAERVNLRKTPELKFVFDDSLEHGFRMYKLINEANKQAAQSEEPQEAATEGHVQD